MSDLSKKQVPNSPRARAEEQILRYYSEATQDYRAWSRRFHMHFGYWHKGLNPLRLEPMLDEMSRQVLARLDLSSVDLGDQAAKVRLLDMGCGLGTTARLLANENPKLFIDAVSLVPWQIERARAFAEVDGVQERVRFTETDFRATPFDAATYDGVYAIESACHAPGLDKRDFVREAARLLRPGQRLVLADGFIKGTQPMNPLLRWCYRKVCDNWALETFAEIEQFRRALEQEGFCEIEVEDASSRIAPSVAHTPAAMVRFFWGELRRSRLQLSAVRWGHLVACALAPIVGMARSRFGYYLVTAVRDA